MLETDEHYRAALQEIHRLRSLLAWEAEVLALHLGYHTFPKSRRELAERQVLRMRMAAGGLSESVLRELRPAPGAMAYVRRVAGVEPSLTHTRWSTRYKAESDTVSVR